MRGRACLALRDKAELPLEDGGDALGNELVKRHGREERAEQALGVAPDRGVAARPLARAGAVPGRLAARHEHGALDGLDHLKQRDLLRVNREAHAAGGTARVLDDPRKRQVMLNRARERVRHPALLCRRPHRDDTLRIEHERREHAQGIVRPP